MKRKESCVEILHDERQNCDTLKNTRPEPARQRRGKKRH